MTEMTETDYLSIGEVLGLLLEEFPDVTISKIRFLESQGLIDPERTPSGYRKFYEPDVELLRVILREQRENYLPLRVIKDRLDSGAIDPSGELPKPDADPNGSQAREGFMAGDGSGDETGDLAAVDVPASAVAGHPAARHAGPNANHTAVSPAEAATASPQSPAGVVRTGDDTGNHDPGNDGTGSDDTGVAGAGRPGTVQPGAGEPGIVRPDPDPTPPTPQLLPGVVLDREELCGLVGLTPSQLTELETYGIVTGRGSGATTVFGDEAVEIAKVAVQFLRAGVDARHLRGWRTAAEREASLYEQLITPRLRQRNPESRAEALDTLRRLDQLGATLRSAMMRTALRHHFES